MKHKIARLISLILIIAVLGGIAVFAEDTAETDQTGFKIEVRQSWEEQLNQLFTTADIMDATVQQLQEAMNKGILTSEQLTQMYLDRINAYNKSLKLNCIITINSNVLEEARNADKLRAEGNTGRLLGIPIIIKDNIKVAGMPTTNGYSSQLGTKTKIDATVVEKLKAEGAIIIAKANMQTNATSGDHSRSSAGGTVHNAYDTTRTPAGSSGGTAVAVTCNFAAFGLGTDTGASIRRPSSFANLYGLRSSFGMVSQYGLMKLDGSCDVIGPMCRSAEDLALAFDILSGTDSKDSKTKKADSYKPEGGYTENLSENGLEGKRIGILANSIGLNASIYSNAKLSKPKKVSDEISGMIDNTLQVLKDSGAEIVDISDILTERMIHAMNDSAGTSQRQKYRNQVTKLLKENNIDAVLYVSQMDVPEKEKNSIGKYDNVADYMHTFGPRLGLPEIVIPMGLSETNSSKGVNHEMALGMNLFSGYGNDDVLIEIAYAYEKQSETRVQPYTTPALPDENLAALASSMIETVDSLSGNDYTSDSWDNLVQNAEALRAVTMYDEENKETVSVATYQELAHNLAKAYDSLKLYAPAPMETQPIESETEPQETESEEPNEPETTTVVVPVQEENGLTVKTGDLGQLLKDNLIAIVIIILCVVVIVVMTVYLILNKQKRKR